MTGIPVVGSQTVFNGQMPGEIYFFVNFIFFWSFYEWSICWRSPLTSSRSMCWCLVKHVTLLKVPCQANCSFFFIWEDFYQCLWFLKFFNFSYDGTNDESKYGSCPSAIYGYGNANATENDDDAAWNENDETRIPALLKSNCHFQHFVTIVFVT